LWGGTGLQSGLGWGTLDQALGPDSGPHFPTLLANEELSLPTWEEGAFDTVPLRRIV